MPKYLMRFDDINARMDWERFFSVKKVIEKYKIKSILGVVPKCEDKFLEVGKLNTNYFENLRGFAAYGDVIAQHGYKHLYDSKSKGFYGNTFNSEFAGHSYETQKKRLLKGKEILQRELLWTPVFMAPNHSFDSITIEALQELKFDTVLDGFAIFPFKKNNLNFIPQISSKPLPIYLPGISQLCVHINSISKRDLDELIKFIERNHKNFIKLEDIYIKNSSLTFLDCKFSSLVIKLVRLLKKLYSFSNSILLKTRCLIQRFVYKIKFKNIDIYKWHLSGTFYCRNYKIQSLKIINSLKPDIYIDIGCGLGEILTKVKLSSQYKLGYDQDFRLLEAQNILNNKDFLFFTNEEELLKNAKKLNSKNKHNIVFSMLGFSHLLSHSYLEKKINKYLNKIGNYTLLIDNVFDDSQEYKFNHHHFLYNHVGLIKYFHKVDQIRSLYCIEIG